MRQGSLCNKWYLLVLNVRADCHQTTSLLLYALVNISCFHFIYCISARRIGDTLPTDKTNKLQDNKLQARASKDSVRIEVCVCVCVRERERVLTGSTILLLSTMIISSKYLCVRVCVCTCVCSPDLASLIITCTSLHGSWLVMPPATTWNYCFYLFYQCLLHLTCSNSSFFFLHHIWNTNSSAF